MGLHEYTKVPVVKQRFTRAYTGTWLRKFILSLHVATQYFLFEAKPVIVQISNLKNSTYTPYFEYNENQFSHNFTRELSAFEKISFKICFTGLASLALKKSVTIYLAGQLNNFMIEKTWLLNFVQKLLHSV